MKILICSGGTGGHIYPALSLARALRKKSAGIEIFFVGTKRKIENIIFGKERRFSLSVEPLCLSLSPRNIYSLGKFISSGVQSFSIINKLKPDIVVGFGAINTSLTLLEASLLKIPTLIHEQNIFPGKTNRFLLRFVEKMAVSFFQTKSYLKSFSKVVVTGNPLRSDLYEMPDKLKACKFFGLRTDKFTLLVLGGSLGSSKINRDTLAALKLINRAKDMQVIHICGEDDFDQIKDLYNDLSIDHRVYRFLSQIANAYAISDLALSRAGASVINELNFFKIPSLLVPYPHAGNHQQLNAEFLSDSGGALLIRDADLNPQRLNQEITRFMDNKEILLSMKQGFKDLGSLKAADRLADEVLSLYG